VGWCWEWRNESSWGPELRVTSDLSRYTGVPGPEVVLSAGDVGQDVD